MSKTIKNHPLVDEVEIDGWGGDSKYFVHTKSGYWFSDFETGSKGFKTVRDFQAAAIEERP